MAMRIEVIAEDHQQARAYAEYKVFGALVQHAPKVRGARVVLQRDASDYARNGVACAVTVTLEPAGSLRAEARGPHAFAAVNRTVDRLAHILVEPAA